MGYNKTENKWDKGEVDAVAGGKTENNWAAKKKVNQQQAVRTSSHLIIWSKDSKEYFYSYKN